MKNSANNTLYFYQGNYLITANEEASVSTIFRTPRFALAEQYSEKPENPTSLLTSDKNGTVLHVNGDENHRAYTVYGHLSRLTSVPALLGFNGEHLHTPLSNYLLGNGYRSYDPRLRRFCSPDSFSPFGEGGHNAYAYCAGDPVNFVDPSGHSPNLAIERWLRFQTTSTPRPEQTSKRFAQPSKKTLNNRQTRTAKKFVTLSELAITPPSAESYNDYTHHQLKQKAQRFHELINKQKDRHPTTSLARQNQLVATARYYRNLDAIEQQLYFRDPDGMFAKAERAGHFWSDTYLSNSNVSKTESTNSSIRNTAS